MTNTLLVSEKHIKNYSIIEHNVDGKVLKPVLINVQETQLKAILGKELYQDVIDAVNTSQNDSIPIADTVKEMLDDYIVPFLVFAALADFIVINNYKLSNKGLMKLNDNGATTATAQELEYVKNYYDNYLSTYKNNLIQYLKDRNLSIRGTDKDITSPSIGWYLGD